MCRPRVTWVAVVAGGGGGDGVVEAARIDRSPEPGPRAGAPPQRRPDTRTHRHYPSPRLPACLPPCLPAALPAALTDALPAAVCSSGVDVGRGHREGPGLILRVHAPHSSCESRA